MATQRWTADETKRALYLYFQLPFGQLHSGNPEIIALASTFGRTASSIAMKLCNFASLDPKITETGRKGLTGATALDRQMWSEFTNDWSRLVLEIEMPPVRNSTTQGALREEHLPFIQKDFLGASTVEVITQQRLGQNFFRRAVLANYNNRCCVTGIADVRLLNASHILPWSSDKNNRHNPENGLCLSATFDRAFDRGLMGFDAEGRARFSMSLLKNESVETRSFFEPYEGKPIRAATRFDPKSEFLQWHHDNCFKFGEK